MIRCRAFRNSDPPFLAEIWRSQAPQRGLVQPMSAERFEELVLSKPYFDNQGLIVAVDSQDVPLGFAHAAFGPSDNFQTLSRAMGVTCMMLVRVARQRQGIGGALLAASEAYLQRCRAEVLYGGGINPLNGFYLGLYGGSELPGVLDSSPAAQRFLESHGYQAIDRTLILEKDLVGFRAPVDRQQMQLRRQTVVQTIPDPKPRTWWEACTWGFAERTGYELSFRGSNDVVGRAMFSTMQPLASSWGVNATGLVELEVDPQHRRQGIATLMISEALRQMQGQGVSLAQVQTMQHNTAALGLYEKLGFRKVDQANVYRKQAV